jgi:hypothetical protein
MTSRTKREKREKRENSLSSFVWSFMFEDVRHIGRNVNRYGRNNGSLAEILADKA